MYKIIFLLQTYCYAVLYCILPLLSPVTYNPPSNRYIYLSTKMRLINPPPPPPQDVAPLILVFMMFWSLIKN